jgi:rRNA maturation endonuclease Nob1
MTIKVTHDALPGGYDYYCHGCDMFFSVSADKVLQIKYCPVCGWDTLICDKETFEAEYPLKAGGLTA